MKWIGLTGGIATGKSTVKKLIEGRGFPVIDADLISHELTRIDGLGYQKIRSHFGDQVFNSDQSLNRSLLAEIIFNDTQKRTELENILHPLIQIEVQKQKEQHRQTKIPFCFYDVPLLFEKNLADGFDSIVLVWCRADVQIQRLKSRSQLSDEEVFARLLSQMEMAYKLKNSDFCIDNSADLLSLEKQVDRLLHFSLLS